MLRIRESVANEMLAHAVRSVPLEGCGLVGGSHGSDAVEAFIPVANAARSAVRFALDGEDLLRGEEQLTQAGLSIVGIMHAHTHTSPYPSPTDIADATNFDPRATWRHVIVSLLHPEPVMRCFRIVEGFVTEEPIVVTGV